MLKRPVPVSSPASWTDPASRTTSSVDSDTSAAKPLIGPVPLIVSAADGAPGTFNSRTAIPSAASMADRSTDSTPVALT